MNRQKGLVRNTSLLYWAKSLVAVNILNSVITLFYISRGVSIEQIFYLGIIWSITTLVTEVPTGYLADRFGRKNTLLLGTVLLILSWLFSFMAHGFVSFAGIFVLMSFSYSCFSGTEEALIYDSLKETGREKEITKYNGRIIAAQHIFNIFMPAIGAFVAQGLTETQFQVLIVVNIIAISGGFLLLLFLTEPKHAQDVTAIERGIFKQSLDTIRANPYLLRVSFNKLLIFVVGFIIWRSYQPFLVEHGISVYWLGVFYFVKLSLIFVLQSYLHKLEEKISVFKLLNGSTILIALCIVGILAFQSSILLFVFILLTIIIADVREPLFASLTNPLISSHTRSTTLSNLNVIKAFLDIPVLLLSGWLAKNDIRNVFWLALVICLLVLVVVPARKMVEIHLNPARY
jgi:MFS family permease